MSGFTEGFGNFGNFVGSNLASAGSNLISGATNALFGGIQARRNWKYQKKAMNLQQKYNLENMQKQFEYQQQAWNAENEYNDPRNAVTRWRLAGISPNAVFGNSPGGAGIAGSAGTPDSSNPSGSGNMDNSHYSPTTTPVEQMQLRMAKELNDAQIDRLKAAADKDRGDTKDPKETKRAQLLGNRSIELDNETKETQKRILDIEAEYKRAEKENDLEIQRGIYQKMLVDIDKVIADTNVSRETRENLIEERKLIQAKIKTEGATQRNLDEDSNLKSALALTEDLLRAGRVNELNAAYKKALADVAYTSSRTSAQRLETFLESRGLGSIKSWADLVRLKRLSETATGEYKEAFEAFIRSLDEEAYNLTKGNK